MPIVTFNDLHAISPGRNRDDRVVMFAHIGRDDMSLGFAVVELDHGVRAVGGHGHPGGRGLGIYRTVDRYAARCREWNRRL